MRKKSAEVKKEDLAQFMSERKGLEVKILEEVSKSRQVAWRVAAGFGVVTVISLIITGITIHRYSEPLSPFLLTYNDANHNIQQVKMTTDKASYGEDLDRMFISRYVVARQSYDNNSLQADYDVVSLMSTANAAEDYLAQFKGRNRIDRVLGDSEFTKTEINSIILDAQHQVATVRFTTTRRARSNPVDDPPKHWIAILGYSYKSLVMNSSQREINPLGFRVTSYRVNPESN